MKQHLSGNLKREIGLGSAVALVVANMVGTGIFTTSGFILTEMPSGQALVAAWIIGGLFALSGALCYGELGAMFPEAGGEYAYLRRSFGQLPAFLSGWISLIVGFSAAIAAAAIAFAAYLPLGEGDPWLILEFGGRRWLSLSSSSLVAVGVVVFLSTVHYHSLRLGQRVQNFLTGFKIVFILVFATAGLCLGEGDGERLLSLVNFQEGSLGGGAFAVSLIFVSFAYSGWNAAAYLGGEIRSPQRNLPMALFAGTVFVVIVYLLLNLVYLYALPVESLQGMLELGSGAATALFGPAIGSAVGWAVAAGLLSVVSAMIMTGPRVYYAMARDGLFFRNIGYVNPSRHTPAYAILLQAGIAIFMIISATFDNLLIYMGFTLSLSAMLTVAGMIKLRITVPDIDRPYKTWGYPLTPLLFICGNLWIIVHSVSNRPLAALYGLGTIVMGMCFYILFKRKACGLHGSDHAERVETGAVAPPRVCKIGEELS